MDYEIIVFDAMYDVTFIAFLQDWLSTIIGGIAVSWIIMKLKSIDKLGQRREATAKLTEFKIESIAHALSNAPPPIGDHFKIEYEKKFNTLIKQEQFIDSNGKT